MADHPATSTRAHVGHHAALMNSAAVFIFLLAGSLAGSALAGGGAGGDPGQGVSAGGHGGAAGNPGGRGRAGGGGAAGGTGGTAGASQDGGGGAAGATVNSGAGGGAAIGQGGGGGGGAFAGRPGIGGGSGGGGGDGGNASGNVNQNAPSPSNARGGAGGGGGGAGTGVVIEATGQSVTKPAMVFGGTGGGGGAGGTASGGAAAISHGIGGSGGNGGTGGIGLLLTGSKVSVTNNAEFIGGAGGTGGNGGDGQGGSGSNSGSQGGAGGNGAAGGSGLIGLGFATTVSTNRAVIGGNGGFGGNGGDGQGGSGSNSGSQGGTGGNGAAGGTSVIFSANRANFYSTVLVIGGGGGNGGDGGNGQGGSGSSSGSTGGAGGRGAAGGDGVWFAGRNSRLVSSAAIIGGYGGNGGFGGNGFGGSGNNSSSVGGNSGAAGAGGRGAVLLGAGAYVVSTGAILGGSGGNGRAGGNGAGGGGSPGNGTGGNGGRGGDGGIGMVFSGHNATFVNRSSVTGGAGGTGGAAGNGFAGGGGGGVATNGTAGAAGSGGIGIVANGIRIDNAGGSIAGGMAGGGGSQAIAIAFIGGRNFVGTGGTINGGVAVGGTASFQPALPGAPVGTPLAITGPLAFARTATYQIRIAGAANDSTVVTGAATPNGGKVFVQSHGTAPIRGARYTILTATGGVAGQFRPNVKSNLAFFAPTLSYDANDVYLTSNYSYVLAGLTLNEQRVLGAIRLGARQPLNGTGAALINGINGVTKTQAAAVLDSLSGEGITAAQNVAFRSAQLFNSTIFDQTTFYGGGGTANSVTLTEPQPAFVALAAQQGQPIRELADLRERRVEPAAPIVGPNRTWRAWATGFGASENIRGNGVIGSARQDNALYGGTLGVDYQLTPNYLVGVALGGTDGDFRIAGRGTSGSTTGGHVALYDIYNLGAWYGASSTSFSYFTNRTTRTISGFGGLSAETLRGNFDSHEFRGRFEVGRHFDGLPSFGALGSLTPFVALEIAELRSNGFGETAISGPGLFRLNVNGQSIADVPAFVGLRLQRVVQLGNSMVLSPTLQVAYVHELAPYRSQTNQLANLPGAVFLVDGARPARDAAQIKAGGELTLGAHASLFANFEGEFSGINQLYAGKGGFKYLW